MAANPPAECPSTGANGEPFVDPVLEFDHMLGVVGVGGDLYEGAEIPDLPDRFVFGMWTEGHQGANGRLYAALPAPEGMWSFEEIALVSDTAQREPAAEGGDAGDAGGDSGGAAGDDYMILPAPEGLSTAQEEGEEPVTGFCILAVEADSSGELYLLTTQS